MQSRRRSTSPFGTYVAMRVQRRADSRADKAKRKEGRERERERERERKTGVPSCQSCSLYLCTWEAGSRCRSPGTCSLRCPPWCSRQNTSTPPRPRTGTWPPEPPRWPRGAGAHRTPLHNSPNGTTHRLHFHLPCMNYRLFGASI